MTWLIKYDDMKFGGKDEMRRTDSRQSLLKVQSSTLSGSQIIHAIDIDGN